MLADDLRQAIESDPRTIYAIAKEAEIRHEVVARFVSGERDLRLETAGKVAKVLGLRLTSDKPPAKPPRVGRKRSTPNTRSS